MRRKRREALLLTPACSCRTILKPVPRLWAARSKSAFQIFIHREPLPRDAAARIKLCDAGSSRRCEPVKCCSFFGRPRLYRAIIGGPEADQSRRNCGRAGGRAESETWRRSEHLGLT